MTALDQRIEKRYREYKNSATGSRGLVWMLSREQGQRLMTSPCYYCGDTPEEAKGRMENQDNSLPLNGIDRVNPAKGYTSSNIVPCCGRCNMSKGRLSLEGYFDLCQRVTTHKRRKRKSKWWVSVRNGMDYFKAIRWVGSSPPVTPVRLSPREVIKIWRTKNMTQGELAKKFNISVGHVSRIQSGKSWAWLTGAGEKRGYFLARKDKEGG